MFISRSDRCDRLLLTALFLLICGFSPVTDAIAAMSLPTSSEAWRTVSAAASPTISSNASVAVPFGFGSAASGGSTLSLSAAIDSLSAAADLYVGVQIDTLGSEIFLFNPANQLVLLSQAGLVPWRTSTTGNIKSTIGTFATADLPAGNYTFYFLLTPSGQLSIQRIWTTTLQISGADSGNSSMEEDIRGKLDLVTGASSSLDMTAITELFSDESVVITTPSDISLTELMAGVPLTISADFGSGYRMTDGSIVSGAALLQITNIVFSEIQLGADITATFTNVTKDDIPLANGNFTGSIALTPAADGSLTIGGNLTFNNLTMQGMRQNGIITISGRLDSLDISSPSGELRLAFSEFTSGDYTVNSGFVNVIFGALDTIITANLQTNEGPVDVNLRVTSGATEGSTLISTISPATVGPYTVRVNNLSFDGSSCGGDVRFTDGSSGRIADVTIADDCNSYNYYER